MRLCFFIGMICLSTFVWAQQDSTGTHPPGDSLSMDTSIRRIPSFSRAVVIDGDTVVVEQLSEVLLLSLPPFEDAAAKRRYYILRKKVLKVYPYARVASKKLIELETELKTIKRRRKKRKHVKKVQKYMQEEFEPELRKLTRTEGQILCKLIYRETGRTGYSIIKKMRSGWTAFWWQAMASWYDITLKARYDPETIGEDKLIETIIIRAIAAGLIEP